MNGNNNLGISLSSIALPLLTVSAAAAFFYYASAILIPITLAATAAYILAPAVAFLKRLKLPHFLAVMVVMLAMLGLGTLLTVIIVSEAADFLGNLPKYQAAALKYFDLTKNWLNSYLKSFPGLFPQLGELKLDPSYFSGVGKIFFKGIGSVTSLVFSGFLLFFLTYFLLSDYEMFVEKLRALFGADKRQTTSAILVQINRQLRGFIYVIMPLVSLLFVLGIFRFNKINDRVRTRSATRETISFSLQPCTWKT